MLADTVPLYATVDPSDDNFGRAREDLARLNAEGLSVALSFSVLCESYTLILYRLGAGRSRRWLGEVNGRASLVNPSQQDYEAAAGLMISGYTDQRLSLFDAVTAVLSERLGLPVWTYDQHFDVMQVEVWRI